MITEKTLRRWRAQALADQRANSNLPAEGTNISILALKQLNDRILRLTQELMDYHLLKKEQKR